MNLKEILMQMGGKHGDAIEIDRVPSFWKHLTIRQQADTSSETFHSMVLQSLFLVYAGMKVKLASVPSTSDKTTGART